MGAWGKGTKRRRWKGGSKFLNNEAGIGLKAFVLLHPLHWNNSFKPALKQIKTIYINTFRLSCKKVNCEFD